MSEELKPCPFCGGEAKLARNYIIIKGKSEKSSWVYCTKCSSKTTYFLRSKVERYMSTAAEAWNRRADNGDI